MNQQAAPARVTVTDGKQSATFDPLAPVSGSEVRAVQGIFAAAAKSGTASTGRKR